MADFRETFFRKIGGRLLLIRLLILFSAVLSAAACSSPMGGAGVTAKGAIAISFSAAGGGNSTARSVIYPPTPEMLLHMEHRVTLTNSTGASRMHDVEAGATTAKFTVDVGYWTVTVDGFLEGEHYATGKGGVDVKADQSNLLSIKMMQYVDPNDGGSGTIDPPIELPDFVFDPGDYDEIFYVPSEIDWDIALSLIGDISAAAKVAIVLDDDVPNAPGFTDADPTFGATSAGNKLEVTIVGNGHRITLGAANALLYIGANQSVTVYDVSLVGRGASYTNLWSLVYNWEGEFIMGNGSSVSGNIVNIGGGGVSVGEGTFTMKGGEISGNGATGTGTYGGGVFVGINGIFNMSGGEIYNNTNPSGSGGGVHLTTDNGSGISGNSAFTMTGGKIYNNSATSGGGVYVSGTGSTFIMEGGAISGNTASTYGGGVYIANTGAFRMITGIIVGSAPAGYTDGGTTYAANTSTYGGDALDNNGTATFGPAPTGIGSGAFVNNQDATIHVNNGIKIGSW